MIVRGIVMGLVSFTALQASVNCGPTTYNNAVGVYNTEIVGLTTVGSSISGCLSAASSGTSRIITNDSDWYNANVYWNIEVVDSGLPASLTGTWLKYSYSITGLNKPGLSHWILDLSDDCVIKDEEKASPCVKGSSVSALEFKNHAKSGGKTLPTAITGVKFDGLRDVDGDKTPLNLTFYSQRVPVWGDFWGKGGSGSTFYNQGLTAAGKGTLASFYIATPDTKNFEIVPEPHEYGLLLGFGVALLIYRKRINEPAV